MKKNLFLLSITLFFFALQCHATDVYHFFPEYKNWERSFGYSVYTPDDLWDYIDGAADAYLIQGFIDLHIAEYTKGSQSIRVEIYQQKDQSHGFGVYAQERSPDLNFIDIGEGAYQEGTILNFLNGKYYVKMYASSEKKGMVKIMEDLAAKISRNINPDPRRPEILSIFPEEGHLPHRDAFVAQGFMGHKFLNAVYKASYKTEDESFTLFVMKEQDPGACEQILRQYLEFAKQSTGDLKQGQVLIKDPYNGNIELLWKDNWIFGISGTENQQVAVDYLEKLQKNAAE